ncbi:MAG: NAD(P)-binding protein [Francisellaceae bacterium]|jgi:hydroxysqualene dehydroxylase|nr:NAD(P)-binding protein [Francisellaceae bacterium]
MGRSIETDVTIIGAGFSGLAASVQLSLSGKKIVLLEASPTPGGRARSIPWGQHTVDNGQHLLIGAYRNVLDHLHSIDVDYNDLFKREHLNLNISNNNKHLRLCIKNSIFPIIINNLFSLASATGLSVIEKFQLLRFFGIQHLHDFRIGTDRQLHSYLKTLGQSDTLITKFWEPIALAALTTPINKASAQVFLHVLKESFANTKGYSDFLFAKTDLGNIFAYPTINWLKSNGHHVFLHHRVTSICPNSTTIKCKNSLEIKSKQIIIATSSHSIKAFAKDLPLMDIVFDNIAQIQYEPITTVYLRFCNPVTLSQTMIGMVGSDILGQWYFDRSIQGDPTIIGIVLSGTGPYNSLSQEDLIARVNSEVTNFIPENKLIDTKVIKEKFAAFSATPKTQKLRPSFTTEYPNIFLCGDYIKNDFPSTLEGAVMNGKAVANAIINT